MGELLLKCIYEPADALAVIRAHDRVTLLFAAHDLQVNHVVVLRGVLEARLTP